MSERWLVRRAALGDASAWEALCEAYLPPVWQWALELGNAEPEAGQVCEMVWLRFAQVLSDFGDDSVRGWLRHAVVEESWRARRLAAARDSLASATDGVDPGAASAFGA